LDELQTRLKDFRCHLLISQPDPEWRGPQGHINREFIRASIPEMDSQIFFLCGPPPFMEAARKILADLGVEPQRIRQETFGGAGAGPKAVPSPSAGSESRLEFARSGKTGFIREGQTLLEAATEAGVLIPSACRQGQCGTCKTRLIEGDVWMTSENGLHPESKARGFILTCVGHARGNARLDV
jgi:Na+-transporting NADH:ubiquinone oxidoreductase subunit NqrF